MEAKPKRQLDVFWGRRLVGQYNLLSDETECFSYDSDYLAAVTLMHMARIIPCCMTVPNDGSRRAMISFLQSAGPLYPRCPP